MEHPGQRNNGHPGQQQQPPQTPAQQQAKMELLNALTAEKEALVDSNCPHSERLLDQEIDKVKTGRDKDKMIEIHQGKPCKIQVKVLIPVKEFSKYNFVGKLLGPKGNSLKRLQEETGTRMFVFGKGSMKSRQEEEEKKKEGGRYAHLGEELHVLVEAFAPPEDAYRRLSGAMRALEGFLIPDPNDEIRQSQMHEMMYLNGDEEQPVGRGVGRGGPPRGRGMPPGRGRGGSATALLATPGGRAAAMGRGMPPRPGRGAPRGAPPARGMGRASAPMVAPRPPPPPAPVADYSEDYYGATQGYEEQYSSYQEQDYTEAAYEQPAAAGGDTQYFDYGHSSAAQESGGYEDYSAAKSWASQPPAYGKATRGASVGADRSHPYGGGVMGRQPRY